MNDVKLLKDRLQIEFQKKDRSGVYGYTQRHLAYNSNKIEGSTLTYDQTSSLFETGTLYNDDVCIRSKDIEETTGHFSMFNVMLKDFNLPLTEEIIKNYHYHLKSGVFEDKANGYPAGEYKNRKNIVSNIQTTPPADVPAKMKELLENYNRKRTISLADIVEFHANFEKIHPFQDGNGRTGRIIIYRECLRNNIFPLIIEDKNKPEYYKCLNIAQNKRDYKPMLNFFENEQGNYRSSVIDFLYEYDTEEDAGSSGKDEYEIQ